MSLWLKEWVKFFCLASSSQNGVVTVRMTQNLKCFYRVLVSLLSDAQLLRSRVCHRIKYWTWEGSIRMTAEHRYRVVNIGV